MTQQTRSSKLRIAQQFKWIPTFPQHNNIHAPPVQPPPTDPVGATRAAHSCGLQSRLTRAPYTVGLGMAAQVEFEIKV